MSVAFDPEPLPVDAWRGWLRHAPRTALRSAPPVVLAACVAVAASGCVSVFVNGLLGFAMSPLCFAPVAACLRARDTGVPTLRVLAHFLATGWRSILLACAVLGGAMVLLDVFTAAIVLAIPALAGKAAAATAHPSLLAQVASSGLRSFYFVSLLPEVGFAVLLACDGLPGRLVYRTASRAVTLNSLSSTVLNVIGMGLLVLPYQPWMLAPVLVPVCTAVTYLAYQQVFHGTEPDKACPKHDAQPASVHGVPARLPV